MILHRANAEIIFGCVLFSRRELLNGSEKDNNDGQLKGNCIIKENHADIYKMNKTIGK